MNRADQMRTAAFASLRGVHHVKLPVADVLRSRDWYQDVLGFQAALDYEEEDRLIGVAMEHPCGVSIALHADPNRAGALRGFPVLALCVGASDDLEGWALYLQAMQVTVSPIVDVKAGWVMSVADPDGIMIELHTEGHPSPDES